MFSELRRRAGRSLLFAGRQLFLRRHLRGSGLEIGALEAPFPVPRGARVRYVDRLSAADLHQHYPTRGHSVGVDIIDDGEQLATVESESQDFVIASHVLEHCENPIGALKNWLRVLRPGGVVALVVPDQRFTFDRIRPLTPLDHLVRDEADGPEASRRRHYEEWVEFFGGDNAAELEAGRFSIHFHVWDYAALRELLEFVAKSKGAKVTMRRNRSENLALLSLAKAETLTELVTA